MAEQHPINGLMDTSMEKIRELVDVNTIIGDPITSPDGTIIIPVSKVSFGFVAGGWLAVVTIGNLGGTGNRDRTFVGSLGSSDRCRRGARGGCGRS